MISERLFHHVLVKPSLARANRLVAVVGYASPAMLERHVGALDGGSGVPRSSIELVIGMTGESGIPVDDHRLWTQHHSTSDSHVSIGYLPRGTADHSKTYVWLHDDEPIEAWTGSANYSLGAFGLGSAGRVETMTSVDADAAWSLVQHSRSTAIPCIEAALRNAIDFFEPGPPLDPVRVDPESLVERALNYVDLSLVRADGRVPAKSGLNWGQRAGRNHNQAYIAIDKAVRESGFFPPTGKQFIVATPEGEQFNMVRAQDGGKALQSHDDNALIGAYFRSRVGLPGGAFVARDDLLAAGGTSVRFYALADGTYQMVFPAPAVN